MTDWHQPTVSSMLVASAFLLTGVFAVGPSKNASSVTASTAKAPEVPYNSTPFAGQPSSPMCAPDGMRRPCRQCAVVFSSAAMLTKKRGPIIDGFDLVFRMNLAPTRTYEDYVGARTDYMVLHDKVSTGSHYSPVQRWSACKRESRNATTGIVFGAQFLRNPVYNASVSPNRHGWPRFLVLPKVPYGLGHLVKRPGTCNVQRKHLKYLAIYPCSTGFELTMYLLKDAETFGCNVTVFGVSESVKDFHYYRSNTRTHIGETCNEAMNNATPTVENAHALNVTQRDLKPGFTDFPSAHNFPVEHDLLRIMHKRGELYLDGY